MYAVFYRVGTHCACGTWSDHKKFIGLGARIESAKDIIRTHYHRNGNSIPFRELWTTEDDVVRHYDGYYTIKTVVVQ